MKCLIDSAQSPIRHMKNSLLCLLSLSACVLVAAAQEPVSIEVDFTAKGKAISPDLFGIFYEDINYAADGGLYPELIQNRTFEYSALEQPTWNQFTAWQLEQRGSGKGLWKLDDVNPIHPNNPHYVLLRVTEPSEGVGILNEGTDGIAGSVDSEGVLVQRILFQVGVTFDLW